MAGPGFGPPGILQVGLNTPFTYSIWNNYPAALDAWMRSPPHAVMLQTVAQSIGSGPRVPLALDTTVRDNYGGATGAGYVCIVPGLYHVIGISNLAWAGGSAAVIATSLTVTPSGTNNPTTFGDVDVPATPAPVRFQHRVAADIPLNYGDTVAVCLTQGTGAALQTGFVACGSRLAARWIAN